jgi:nicotinate-nucleotide--dimethylbenzimidazole phosphoribosyltransferase
VSIDLSELAARVVRPDDDARDAARSRLAEMYPSGAFGRLGELAEWLAGVQGHCPTRPIGQVRFIAVAGSSEPPGPGSSAGPMRLSQLLAVSPATPRLVEDGRTDGQGREDIEQAFESGLAVADEEVDNGADLLVAADIDAGSAIAAATAVAVITGSDIASVTGRGTGIDDREWMRRCAAVRDGARVARRVLADGADVLDLLSTLGSAPLAVLTGLITQAAVRQTPVVLDGLGTTAAALVAHRLSPRTARWIVAGHASPDPGQAAALDKLRLRPLIDYAIALEDGTGALLAVPHVQAAARLLTADDSSPFAG